MDSVVQSVIVLRTVVRKTIVQPFTISFAINKAIFLGLGNTL